MISSISDSVREHGRKAKDRLGRAYESWIFIDLPLDYEGVRTHVNRGKESNIEVVGENPLVDELDEDDPVGILDGLTEEGEAVEDVDFGYSPRLTRNRIEAEIYCSREDQDYTVRVESTNYR